MEDYLVTLRLKYEDYILKEEHFLFNVEGGCFQERVDEVIEQIHEEDPNIEEIEIAEWGVE